MPKIGKLTIRQRVEQIAGKDSTAQELQGLPRMDTERQPEENPRPLAPYVCPASHGRHRFQALGNEGDKCLLCALWRDESIDYESPLGLTKIEISKDSPKLKARGGWRGRIFG
jgi:hypothetical protein